MDDFLDKALSCLMLVGVVCLGTLAVSLTFLAVCAIWAGIWRL